MWSLLPPALLWWLSVYVKGTKQILAAVCVVEFTGLHSNFLVCKLQFYTVKFHSCKNYLVKLHIYLYFFYSVYFTISQHQRTVNIQMFC